MYRVTEKMIRDYIRYLKEQEKSGCTTEKYERDIRKFFGILPANGDFTGETVRKYKRNLQERYAVSSVNSMLTALNGFLKYMGAGELCVKVCRQQQQSFLPEEKHLTMEEYHRLLAKARENRQWRIYHILETLGSTGIRISELRYITVEGVRRGKIAVYAKDKYRCICISRSLQHRLLKYCEQEHIDSGYIFVTRNGTPVHRNNVWAEMKKLSVVAGVCEEKVYPHNLRHLFARTFYEKKKDVLLLADLLGHSSVDTTRIYTKISEQYLHEEILELGLVDFMT